MSNPVHVIVVDDDAEIRAVLSGILEREGYRVTTCADGEAFWAAIATDQPDIVLLDLKMPGENGFSIARRLRGQSDAGIIIVSAMGDVVDRVVGLEVGADDFVTKPFDGRELVARIHSVLRRKAEAPAATPVEKRIAELAEKLDTVSGQIAEVGAEAHHIEEIVEKAAAVKNPKSVGGVTWRPSGDDWRKD
jgi:two-component system OmpR family response regulator